MPWAGRLGCQYSYREPGFSQYSWVKLLENVEEAIDFDYSCSVENLMDGFN
jgi:hypothetical protein